MLIRIVQLLVILSILMGVAVAAFATDYKAAIFSAAIEHDIDPHLALAIAKVESGINPKAVGKAGEVGIFQLHPKYHRITPVETENINTAVKYLSHLKKRCMALYKEAWINCYNRGPNRERLKKPKAFNYYRKVTKEYNKLVEDLNGKDVELLP